MFLIKLKNIFDIYPTSLRLIFLLIFLIFLFILSNNNNNRHLKAFNLTLL